MDVMSGSLPLFFANLFSLLRSRVFSDLCLFYVSISFLILLFLRLFHSVQLCAVLYLSSLT